MKEWTTLFIRFRSDSTAQALIRQTGGSETPERHEERGCRDLGGPRGDVTEGARSERVGPIEVDVHGLDGGVVEDGLGRQLPADTRHLESSEGHLRRGRGGGKRVSGGPAARAGHRRMKLTPFSSVLSVWMRGRTQDGLRSEESGKARTAVDPDGAGLDLLGNADGARDVTREDGRGEAVHRVVGLWDGDGRRRGRGGRGKRRGQTKVPLSHAP